MRIVRWFRSRTQGNQVLLLAVISVLLALFLVGAAIWVVAVLAAMPRRSPRHHVGAWVAVAFYLIAFVLPAANTGSGWIKTFPDGNLPGWYAFATGWIVYPLASAMNVAFLFAIDRYRRGWLRTSRQAALVAIVLGLQPLIGISWSGYIADDLPVAVGYWAWLAGPVVLGLAAIQDARSSERPSAADAVS